MPAMHDEEKMEQAETATEVLQCYDVENPAAETTATAPEADGHVDPELGMPSSHRSPLPNDEALRYTIAMTRTRSKRRSSLLASPTTTAALAAVAAMDTEDGGMTLPPPPLVPLPLARARSLSKTAATQVVQ